MLQRLHGSPTAHGYRALSGDGHSHSHMSYASPPAELSHDGTGTLHYAPSKGTLTSSKSFGDIRAMAGRQRTKKSRAMRWLVLGSDGDRKYFSLDKRQLIQTCRLEVPIRDMRVLDGALGTETLAQLLVRDNALVFSMEHVRLIIMCDKVIVPLDDSPSGAQQSAQGQQQQQQPSGERSDLKDRFLTQLESVVMDWALQHHPAVMHGTTHGPAGGGGGGMLASFGSGPGGIAFGGGGGGGGGGITQAMASQAHAPLGPQPLARTTSLNTSLYHQQQGPGYGGTCTPGQGAAPGQMGSATLAAALEVQLGAKGTGRGQAAGAGSAHGGGAHMGGSSEAGAGSQAGYDPEYQPFEMVVLEAALAEICSSLSREVDALQVSCGPALEALTKTADTANLEAVRRIKTQHARLVTRVTAAKEALEGLMEDDDDMVRMCLTQQAHMRLAAVAAAAAQQQAAAAGHNHTHSHNHTGHHRQHHSSSGGLGGGGSQSPPSPGGSPPHDSHHSHMAMLLGSSLAGSLTRPASLAARAVRHQIAKKSGSLGEALAEAAAAAAAAVVVSSPGAGMAGSGTGLAGTLGAAGAGGGADAGGGGGGGGGGASTLGNGHGHAPDIMEHDFLDVENLLESYAIIVDTTYQTLLSIGEYIDDTEDLINIQLDYSRNKLIRFELLLTTGTFALTFFNMVTGMLGENLVLPDTITQDLWGFFAVNGATLTFCISAFLTLVMAFRWQKVL